MQQTELIDDTFVARAIELAEKKLLIVTFVNRRYLPLTDVWIAYFLRYGHNNYLIFALDRYTFERLKLRKLNVCLFDMSADFSKGNLWVQRVLVFQALIDADVDILHTDIDAFWVKDPVEEVGQMTGDIVCSRDSGIPAEAVKAWGFSLCCGFICVRSCKATKNFVRAWSMATHEYLDDQRALNHLLLARRITWSRAENTECNVHARVDEYQLEVTGMADDFASRGHPPTGFIYHPWLSAPNVYDKVAQALVGLRRFPPAREQSLRLEKRLHLAPGFWLAWLRKSVKRHLARGDSHRS
jgi:hypothetical protein